MGASGKAPHVMKGGINKDVKGSMVASIYSCGQLQSLAYCFAQRNAQCSD